MIVLVKIVSLDDPTLYGLLVPSVHYMVLNHLVGFLHFLLNIRDWKIDLIFKGYLFQKNIGQIKSTQKFHPKNNPFPQVSWIGFLFFVLICGTDTTQWVVKIF